MSSKNVSTSTVRRRLWEAGSYSRISVKKPLLKKQNNARRLQWAKAHKDWTIEQWNKVLWIDESKYEIIRPNRRVYVRRRVDERRLCYIIGSFCQFQSRGFASGEVQIESNQLWLILWHHAIPSGTSFVSEGFVLMQFNDPTHTSKLCHRYIKSQEEQHVLQLMSWPTQSVG